MSSFVKRAYSLFMLRDRNLDPAETYARIADIMADAMSERAEGLEKAEYGECLCRVRF
jgi:hypothetical protein